MLLDSVAFSMYDLNKNNYITRDEFKFILNMMVGSNITPDQVLIPCQFLNPAHSG